MFFKNKKQKLLSILLLPIMPLSFMLFTPWGSINPTEIGFWVALFGGIVTELFSDYLLAKYQKNTIDKD